MFLPLDLMWICLKIAIVITMFPPTYNGIWVEYRSVILFFRLPIWPLATNLCEQIYVLTNRTLIMMHNICCNRYCVIYDSIDTHLHKSIHVSANTQWACTAYITQNLHCYARLCCFFICWSNIISPNGWYRCVSQYSLIISHALYHCGIVTTYTNI